MHYDEALDYMRSAAADGSHLGLDRVRRLLHRMGRPQHGLPCVHVGGTNGKGSVSAMLTAIFTAAGLRVGTFTSPHLSHYTERWAINGHPVPPERFARLVNGLRPLLDAVPPAERPTEFEIHTALALRLFREEGVDMAVIEVGLGGRLDATNLVQPLVTVITNVTHDHIDYLGDDLSVIAREKAGIIKPGVPVVTAAVGVPAGVIEKACREKGSPLLRVGRDITWVSNRQGADGQRVDLRGPDWAYGDLPLGLHGPHQAVNAACAAGAVEILRTRGIAVDAAAVRAGLARVRWPGRFEILSRRGLTVVLDAAHNVAAAEMLAATLRETFPGVPVTMVLGILEDKEREELAAVLAPLAERVLITRPPTDRAGRWRELAAMVARHGTAVAAVRDNERALNKALTRVSASGPAGCPSGIVLVTGSIYLLGAIRRFLDE